MSFSLDGINNDLAILYKKIERIGIPESALMAVRYALERTRNLDAASDGGMIIDCRVFLNNIIALPWRERAVPTPMTINKAAKSLDKSLAGMQEVKERLLDIAASERHIRERTGGVAKPERVPRSILLVGIPGVGKTSVAFSLAKILNRDLSILSLAGRESNESLLRGTPRMWQAAEPGFIMKSFMTTGSRHPLILLDEIDKVAVKDGKNSVISTLLELFDGRLASSFLDSYFDFHFDASSAIFVCTANDIDDLPQPLLSRMEIIDVRSYTESEKIAIATDHLVPGVAAELCMSGNEFKITEKGLQSIIRGYTKEGGVRQLRAVIRQAGMRHVRMGGGHKPHSKHTFLSSPDVAKLLGPPTYVQDQEITELRPGLVCGLSAGDAGGVVEMVEVCDLHFEKYGTPVMITGLAQPSTLESALVARTAVLSYMAREGLETSGLKPIHVHFPDGSTPKEGPSAGTALCAAIYSYYTGKSIRADIVMTGEIMLSGYVGAVGAIHDKIAAAVRTGKTRAILPFDNRHDVARLPEELRSGIEIVLVKTVEELIREVFSVVQTKT